MVQPPKPQLPKSCGGHCQPLASHQVSRGSVPMPVNGCRVWPVSSAPLFGGGWAGGGWVDASMAGWRWINWPFSSTGPRLMSPPAIARPSTTLYRMVMPFTVAVPTKSARDPERAVSGLGDAGVESLPDASFPGFRILGDDSTAHP